MDISPSVDWGQTSVSARYLAEYSGSLCPCCDVTCDRVMSGSVTLIGHTPTVTIHNRHPPPLCVSHDYCFHLIKYYNHNPFPIGPRLLAFTNDSPRVRHTRAHSHESWWSVSEVATVSVDMLTGEGRLTGMVRCWGRMNAWWYPFSTRGIIHYATLYTFTAYVVMYNYGRGTSKDTRNKPVFCELWSIGLHKETSHVPSTLPELMSHWQCLKRP